ncbi:MAG TPA: CHASE3 domain-containing protein, partial [Acidothermaceae bacterium]|nr:CHASE3 domain-containing protein [Acidothermaceae bacterium]
MSYAARGVSYVLIAVTVVTGVLLGAFTLQRREALSAGASSDSAVLALTSMLDEETGVRGYLYTGNAVFLEPYLNGQASYAQQRLQVASTAKGDATTVRLATQEDATAISWEKWASAVVAARGATDVEPVDVVQQQITGKELMDSFRASNAALRTSLNQRRNALLRRTGFIWTAIVVTLAALFALFGFITVRRGSRARIAQIETEVTYRARQAVFSDLIQAVDSEAEAHELVQRHLHRSIAGSTVSVLSRNNSDNRLSAVT